MSQLFEIYREVSPDTFESTWESPSNIAFVKYWGKKGHQIPANPSLSMTLNECKTTTTTTFSPADKLSVVLRLDGKRDDKFAAKVFDYLIGLQDFFPWIAKISVEIETSNSFPHSAGIASSASGLSAFALTFTDYLSHLKSDGDESLFFKRASLLSRLASGSACRSVYGGYVSWGESDLLDSTNEYATPFDVHPDFSVLHDTVLIISSAEKNISSRSGHSRMAEHFFAESRFAQAKNNFSLCAAALRNGDIEALGGILEAEALSLHAMMLTSPSAYTLLRPNTLSAINAIWQFRHETKLPLYFTLDAGPNLHLIYPESFKNKIHTFITNELGQMGERMIDDKTGFGPRKC
jgi:diphosphomevalonate decarboxylase